MIRSGAALAVVLVGCSQPSGHMLPGASPMKPSGAPTSAAACGRDVSYNGATVPDIRYTYTYDALGRLAHEEGLYSAGGTDDTLDYTYDNLDRMAHSIQTRGWGDWREEQTIDRDSLGDGVVYGYAYASGNYTESSTTTLADFDDIGNPAHARVAQITDTTQVFIDEAYTYDQAGRLLESVHTYEDTGRIAIATYAYDDAARTLTYDYDNGAQHVVLVYDDRDRELSETWTGNAPMTVDQQVTYEWLGDRLATYTVTAGSTQNPHQLEPWELDTYRYDCATARNRGR